MQNEFGIIQLREMIVWQVNIKQKNLSIQVVLIKH